VTDTVRPFALAVAQQELDDLRDRLRDLRHYRELDRGGHFAAFEQPAVFTDELREFFRGLR
jgi:pimeloyl-ACP methyl ester carboxylesterase